MRLGFMKILAGFAKPFGSRFEVARLFGERPFLAHRASLKGLKCSR